MYEWIKRRCHWQNLNEDENGNIKGSILRYGRLWLHRAYKQDKSDYYRRSQIQLCWRFGGGMRWLGAGMALFDGDSQRDIGLSLGFWFGSLYLTLENILPKRFAYPRHSWQHDTSLTITNDGSVSGLSVSLNIHHAGHDCFNCKGWNGPHWYWWPIDSLLGKPVHESKALPRFRVGEKLFPEKRGVLMPEGIYPVEVVLTRDTWKRARWPWPRVIQRAHIECKRPIPKPGKGENAWDCCEDATFSLTCPASTVEEALEKLKASIMRDRERHGGKGWLPESVRIGFPKA